MEASRTVRAAALAALFVAVAAAPAAVQAAATQERLANPSLEGLPGRDNGYDLYYDGAETSIEARSGRQSVNLASGGSVPQEWDTLGLVKAYAKTDTRLASLVGVSFWHRVPSTPPPVVLRHFLSLDVNGDGLRDACFVHQGTPLGAVASWTQLAFGPSTRYSVSGQTCVPAAQEATLSDLQMDPAYASATVLSVSVETATTEALWPPATPVLVDDVALSAAVPAAPRVAVAVSGARTVDAAPGVPARATFFVRNLGGATDTVTFAADAPAGWQAAPSPASLTLAAGQGAHVEVAFVPTARPALGAVALRAASAGGAAAEAFVTVRLPVTVDLDLAERYGPLDAVAVQLAGTWRSGAPAAGAEVIVREQAEAAGSPAGPPRTFVVTLGPDGRAAFALPTDPLGANFPGQHRVLAAGLAGGTPDAGLYAVGPL